MTNVETTDKAAAVAAQGAHVAPEKAPGKKAASQKKGAPKAKKTGKGAKQGAKVKAAAPKKADKGGAKASQKTAKPTAAEKVAAPRAESKGAKILEMIARAKGATQVGQFRIRDGKEPPGIQEAFALKMGPPSPTKSRDFHCASRASIALESSPNMPAQAVSALHFTAQDRTQLEHFSRRKASLWLRKRSGSHLHPRCLSPPP